MAVYGARLVGFGPTNDNAIISFFNDTGIKIRVSLLTWPLGSVALWVGHPAHEHEILILNSFQVLEKAGEVFGPMFLVDFIGGDVQGVESVKSNAALKTARCFMRDDPQHLDLFYEVVH